MMKSISREKESLKESQKERRKKVRKNKPPEGLNEMLIITEKQFSGKEYISGEEQNCVIDGEERLIVI